MCGWWREKDECREGLEMKRTECQPARCCHKHANHTAYMHQLHYSNSISIFNSSD
jgi:hypothetical protein